MKNNSKLLLTVGTIGISITPVLAVVACGSKNSVSATSSAEAIKNDSQFENLNKHYSGFSKDTIKIIGHKQEVQKQSKAAVDAFNEAFGTNLEIEQIGGTTNYSQYLATKFTGGAEDVGLVGVEMAGEVKSLGTHIVDFTKPTWTNNTQLINLGGHNVLPAASESLGVIYNKSVFNKNGIKVHEGETAPTGVQATNGLVMDGTKIKDVYTNGLDLAAYKKLANQLNDVQGIDAFYSTTKTDEGNIWPYTNHLLSAVLKTQDKLTAIKAFNANPTKAITDVQAIFGTTKSDSVPSAVKNAIDVYSIGSNTNTNTIDAGMGKISTGQVAMSQNGTWAKDQIFKTNPKAEIGFLPMPVFGTVAGHNKAQFMKGTTQKWALTTSDASKQKTINLFLEWLYQTQTGLNALYGDFSSETPYGTNSLTPKIDNPLFKSAVHYKGNAVTEGELALSILPSGFNNGLAQLRDVIHDSFQTQSKIATMNSKYLELAKA